MKRSLLMFTALMLLGALAFGQRTITGVVKDDNGNPVSGASVIIKGTEFGVAANAAGEFKITAKTGDVLEISAADFIKTDFKLGNQSEITITLKPGTNVMEAVVVTALGIKREKRALTYATETINSDALNKSGSGNPLNELGGKASGVTVINSSGDPGSGTYVRLRGVTSITGDNQPLMVIDGVPIDNSINNYDPTSATPNVSGANSNQTGGSIAGNRGIDINPNDIESITVLKGPAATALYGIKAASGALIITTKKGSLGAQKTNINFNSSTSMDHTNKLPGLQDQFAQGTGIDPNTGAFLPVPVWIGPDGRTGDGTVPTFLGNSIASGRRVTWGPAIDTLFWTGVPYVWDPNGRIVGASSPLKKIPVTPYDRYKFFQTGFTTNNNLSFTGGAAKNSYRLSLGNLFQQGVVPKSKYNKSTIGVSGQAKLTDRLTVSGSMDYIISESNKVQQGSNVSGVMLGLLRTPPTFDNSNGLSDAASKMASYVIPITEIQRNYRGGGGYDNPYWTVNRNPFDDNVNRVFGYAAASYLLFDWMTLNYRLGGDVYSQDDKNFYDIHSTAFPAGKGILNEYFNNQYNSDFTINLHKTFDKFSGTVILGQNYFYNKFRNRTTLGSSLISPTFFDMSNFLSYTASEGDGEKRTMAFYGDATVNYEDMIFLNVTGRRETSSSLPAANRNFFYPSAGLSWVFTELPGLKNNKKILSYGKARVSYAQVGKDAPIQGLQTYYKATFMNDGFTSGVFFPITFNGIPTGAYQNTSTISVIGNPNLKPEKTQSYEGGLDLGFLDSRINLTATYYYSKTTDAIFTVPYAYSTGFASKLQNAGVLTNKGLELSLNTTPVKNKDFNWDLNLNWSYNRNLVKQLYLGVDKVLIGGFQNSEIDAFAGKPFGQIYGSVFVRANTDSANKASTSGALLINDSKTDPGYGKPIPGSRNAIIGDINPKWQGSVINNLTYKGFTLGFQIDVREGGQIWNGTRGALDYFGTSAESADRTKPTVFQGLLGHLNAEGDVVHYAADGVTEVPGPGATNTISTVKDQYYWQNIGNSFVGPAEASVEDGSYIKLRQVSLTYSLPKKLLGKSFNIASLTVFANNIILQTKYKGVDPETSLGGSANFQGEDYFNNPGIRNIGFRLNIGL